ncbi:MAG: hypothetical protein IPO05_18260 [Flavobacteriales bacterium]|nr:hypothetical protein [Flavobacteriales bacterium]
MKNCLIAFGTLIAGASMAHDNGPVSQWSVRHFDVRNGLPQSSVMDMASDSMGPLDHHYRGRALCDLMAAINPIR